MKNTLHMPFIGLRVRNCHPFRSTVSCVQGIGHITIFPSTPILKFQSATKCFAWLIVKKSNSLYYPMVANVRMQFDWDRRKL